MNHKLMEMFARKPAPKQVARPTLKSPLPLPPRPEQQRKAADPEIDAMVRAASDASRLHRTQGFNTFGEALHSIARACDGVADPRLVRAPTGAGEIDPSAGGFLVPAEFSQELIGSIYEFAQLAPLCDVRETSKPIADVRLPAIDEQSRVDGSRWGGVLGYWLGEGMTLPTTFPRFRHISFDGRKLSVVIVVSNELAADVPLLESHLRRVAVSEFAYQLDKAILLGDGSGKPLGITNAPATITVPKETGQASATIVTENVRKMWSRLPAPSRRTAVWIVGEDCDEALEQMLLTIGTAGAISPTAAALYMPQGAAGNKYPLLKGRPMIVVEEGAALGSVGDIVLADLSRYIIIHQPIATALSAHVRFLTDESVFKFTLRVDGQSAFASPITSGGKTRSPFVTPGPR